MEIRNIDDVRQFAAEKLRKHNLFQTERFFLDVYCLAPGQEQKPHAHEDADKVYVVLEGRCRFTVDGAAEEHGPSVAIFCPAGSSHGVINAGAGPARLLVWMSPPPAR
ncbi:cupin domain-containing protein [Vulgatibacter sp.]|uniref:cupin domain-containing protein n=1 Tax=Vulgatibacter sp. TaxID=1971226 RepID=UPI00356AA985